MEKIRILFTSSANPSYQEALISHLQTLDVEITLISNNKPDYLKIYEAGIDSNSQSRLIIVDDYGTLPFLVLGKIQDCVVAQISDEHSAHMTSEHNGANILCVGTELNSVTTLKNILTKFITQHFAAGRHMVRIDMLKTMLKSEGN